MKEEEEKETDNPIYFRSTTSPSWNLTSPETKMARLRYCRDVTVGVSSPEQAPLIRLAAERWQEVPSSFLRVISTVSLWDWWLWRLMVWRKFVIVHMLTLFLFCFFRCLRLVMMLTCPQLTTSVTSITDCAGPKLWRWRRGTTIW